MKIQNKTPLIERMLAGDRRVFRRFYGETRFNLLSWFLSRVKVGADAEELVQDTYLSFLDSLPLYRGDAKVTTFLYAIAKHELMDYWRKKYAKRAIATIPFIDQVYTEKLYSATQTKMMIRAAYEVIKPTEARILKWKYEDQWSLERIARELSISVKAAESRLFRARRAFQVAYGGGYE